jgi:hypothetical protein
MLPRSFAVLCNSGFLHIFDKVNAWAQDGASISEGPNR